MNVQHDNLLCDLDPYNPLTHPLQTKGVNVSFNNFIRERGRLSDNIEAQVTETERTHVQTSTTKSHAIF